MERYIPKIKAVFDAMTDDSSSERTGGDFGREILDNAPPELIREVKEALTSGDTISEAAARLDIWPRIG